MRVLFRRRFVLPVMVITTLAFLLPPFIQVNRLRFRIVQGVKQTLGRDVAVGSVHLQLLPRPGFLLHRLIIADDPAFSAEPMLRADEVTATLRLASLWRGRLEIANLSLKSGTGINPPSLNLVRAADGRWNVEALLQRTSQMPSAPTAQPRAESRPRFPYIEAEGGRINFKIGQEKKSYVLTEADFALWLDAENEWAFRLAATPLRTDLNLSDTGVVRVNGHFRRASNLRDTPLNLDLAVENAQLGAVTKLIYGRDRGWRGSITASAHLMGTPAALMVTAQAGIHDFRRYDISATDTLRLEGQCTARYSTVTEQLSALNCRMPLGSGVVQLRGDVEGLTQPRVYNLDLAAERIDLQTLIRLARHAKKDLPEDLSARGELRGGFNVRRSSGNALALWSGAAHTSEITLTSALLKPALQLPPLGFSLEGPGSEHFQQAMQKGQRRSRRSGSLQPPTFRVAFAPFRLPVTATTALDTAAWFNRSEYSLHLQGEAWVQRLLQIGRALGLRVPGGAINGMAHVDLQIAGNWAGFAAPHVTGRAELHDVTSPVTGLNSPVRIHHANLQLYSEAAVFDGLELGVDGSSLQFTGNARVPRNCVSLEQCPLTFDLQADEISLEELNRLMNPKRHWFDVFADAPSASALSRINATGRVTTNRLLVKALVAQKVTATLVLRAGVLALADLNGDVLGGKHRGDWRADFTGAEPQYSGTGMFVGLAMPQVATLMDDDWAAGSADATYQLTLSGRSVPRLTSSMSGIATVTWRNGILRHIALDGHSGALQFQEFTGHLDIADGALTLAKSSMKTPTGVYQVSGTASLQRQLDLKLRNRARAYDLSGPLEKPSVTPIRIETQAALQR